MSCNKENPCCHQDICEKCEVWNPSIVVYASNNIEQPLTGIESTIEFDDIIESTGGIYKNGKIKINKYTEGLYNIVSRVSMGSREVIVRFISRIRLNGNVIDQTETRQELKRDDVLLSIIYPLKDGDVVEITVDVSEDPLLFVYPTFLSASRLSSLLC